MSNRRFFVNSENISNGKIIIDDDQLQHISKALRLEINEKIELFDGLGSIYTGKIQEISRRFVKVEIIETRIEEPSGVVFTLIQSLPKAKKMDLIVKKTTEIGVTEIFPIETKYSILKKKDFEKKSSRFNKLIIESCKQSRRNRLLKINSCINMSDLKIFDNYDLKIIPSTEGFADIKPLKEVLENNLDAKSICFLIGAEGGFSDDELDLAIKSGFKPVSFGKNILRTETAAIYLSSVLSFFYS